MKNIFRHTSGTIVLFCLFMLLLNWPIITVYFSSSLFAALAYIFVVLIVNSIILFIGTRSL